MTEPVPIKHSFLVALTVLLQTLTPPLVAAATLYGVISLWHITFSARALVVIFVLLLATMIQPPNDMGSQLTWKPQSMTAGAVLQWLLLLIALLIIGYSTGTLRDYPLQAFFTWAIITPVLLVMATMSIRELSRRVILSAVSSRKVIVAGYNRSSLSLARALARDPTLRLEVVGFFDDRAAERLAMEDDVRLVGRLADLGAFANANGIDVIFIALPMRHLKRVLDLLDDLRDTTASIYYVPDVFVFDLIQARPSEISNIPVVALCETPFSGYRGILKRLIDVGVASIFLICAAPFLLLVALLVKVSSPGPAIFCQRRYGLDGREIMVYKFRTMRVTEDGSVVRQASRTDRRVTSIGRFLRRYSIDELPQFVNVLQGRMSLVGPRPHAVAHNEQYRKLIKGYMIRHKVLPGITGLAQINGARGETTKLEEMEARVRFDLDYLRHWSPALDFKIMLLTLVKLFHDEKAY
jgi:putative colanic acid biosysnthesis UDP-glucose lipid carrier transferase